MQKLRGEAADKLSNIKPEDLLIPESVQMIKTAIEKAYHPIEDCKVGAIMDEFLHNFARKKDEEISDYLRRWHVELTKAERVWPH